MYINSLTFFLFNLLKSESQSSYSENSKTVKLLDKMFFQHAHSVYHDNSI